MEVLVKRRKPVRTRFTKNYDDLLQLLNDEENCKEEIVRSKLTTLERLTTDLHNLNEQVAALMLEDSDQSEGEFEREYESVEKFNEDMDCARVKVEQFIVRQHTGVQITNNGQSVISFPNSSRRKLRLPKIELKKFSGDIKDYLGFWSQFRRIHEDGDLENEDKFHYLIQATTEGSRAREIVDSFPSTAENYNKAIESLKNRFGKEELLIEYYVRELLSLVIKNATEDRGKRDTARLYDNLESHLRALESIGMTSDKYAAMLFPLVESCIPEDILRVWLRSPMTIDNEEGGSKIYGDRLKHLMLFLRKEVEGEERISLAKAGFRLSEVSPQRYKKKQQPDKIVPTATDLFSGEQKKYKLTCVFCGKPHESKECFQAQRLSLSEKQDMLKRNKGCFVCLKPGHRAKDCKGKVSCIVCSKKHCTIMCPQLEVKQKDQKCEEKTEQNQNTSLSSQCSSDVVLQTLLVNLEAYGRRRTVRALIDTGSQRSYILKSTAREMGYQPVKSEVVIHALFGGGSSKKMEHQCYDVLLKSLVDNYSCIIQVLDQPIICGSISRPYLSTCMGELRRKGIHLTDVGAGQPPIEILIGSDALGKLYTGTVKELECGLTAVQTKLGWVVMGKVMDKSGTNTHAAMMTTLLTHTSHLPDLWKLDALGILDPCESQTNEEIETAVRDHFKRTVKRDPEGRYEVSFPWLDGREELPDNRVVAEKRLIVTTTKLEVAGKFDDYDKVLKNWLNEGVVEVVQDDEQQKRGHYLPHRGVFKDNSTTSVRPVFDASCKQKGSCSLNDCLAKGPNLLDLIPKILLKFRQGKIGVISDIKQAFLQISVDEQDRDCLRFLWWENVKEKKVNILRHRRVVFGVNCSPFLLGAVIQHHLSQYEPPLKGVAETLKDSFYVDNCVTSVNSEEELHTFVGQATEIMAEGKFDLRGWEHTALCTEGTAKPSPVLGLLWDKVEDKLYCDVSGISYPQRAITRRNILSTAQRVFDPIGFTSPVTLCPKILLQESWKSKLGWDAELPEEMSHKFMRWVEDLPILSDVRIPRWTSMKETDSCALHVFCDASKSSYAAVVFLRCEDSRRVSVQLLQAKSRIAPLKRITIPRLELLACCIGTRLATHVRKGLDTKDLKEYYWTDSATALHWITQDGQWGTFVRNRVKEICSSSNVQDWRHIPGHENPADLPSRGCSAKKLLESRWWEGPSWLKLSEENWPKSESMAKEDDIDQERKRDAISLTVATQEEAWYLKYFSSYTKIVRMMAWMLRFIHNVRVKKDKHLDSELSTHEVKHAERRLLKFVQNDMFMKKEKMDFKSLCTLEDEDGLLRIKTKIVRRKDDADFRFPILLPSDHKVTHLLVMEEHMKASHAGVQILLSIIRERFWIVKGRKTLRSILSKCVRCKRFEAKRIESVPVELPENRVREASAFEVVGIDLAGPLHLKNSTKSWIVIFTCAVFRAVHFELVTSLSVSSFILALRRFISRRGRPHVVYSDNGTNFHGTENLLKALDWDKIVKETAISRIEWRFNPPTAAWWGGWWERLIQTLKKLVRRVLGRACVEYDEMLTILIDCEAVVNSRPLTYLSEDQNDLVPLTPAMFIQDIPRVGVPDLDHIDSVNLSKRYRYQQRLKEDLRKRFRVEYLGQLIQRRNELKKMTRDLQVGEVVLIGGDDRKKMDWPMGRVAAVYPGKDNKIRVVKVKTATGMLIRPVQRIYPLEICSKTTSVPMDEPEPAVTLRDEKVYVTRSGRRVNIPSRFLQ